MMEKRADLAWSRGGKRRVLGCQNDDALTPCEGRKHTLSLLHIQFTEPGNVSVEVEHEDLQLTGARVLLDHQDMDGARIEEARST